ncbi:hypothetical protein EV648_105379 [Kribbella sp. VKM Ac-2568]|nr:hypothetical protein EV648_105379 [Kribbella sp. VKM Ac-2568]
MRRFGRSMRTIGKCQKVPGTSGRSRCENANHVSVVRKFITLEAYCLVRSRRGDSNP